MQNKDSILERINTIKNVNTASIQKGAFLYSSILSLATELYGSKSPKTEVIRNVYDNRVGKLTRSSETTYKLLTVELYGVLDSIKSDVEQGLISSIRDESKGEVYADFIALAKKAIEDGTKDVASVLACAALEDSLKKFAESNGLDVDDKDMSAVISTLKGAELVGKTQSKILNSYTTLRNKAFHAEWDKIKEPDVRGLIAFVEGFILEHFSG
jgi:hypothetical protein